MVRGIIIKISAMCILMILAAVLLTVCNNSLDAYIKNDEIKVQEAGILAAPEKNITGSVITGHEEIVLTFDETIDKSSLLLGGDLGDLSPFIFWDKTAFEDDTLRINKDSLPIWTEGSGKTLTISCEAVSGKVLTGYSVTFDVFYGTCVDDDSTVTEKNGSVKKPYDTIQAGIDQANAKYVMPVNGIDTAEVRVSGGDYEKVCEISTPTYVADIKEGISLYGGYDVYFASRNPTVDVSYIIDTSIIGGTSTVNTVRAFNADGSSVTITASTIIDGFTITIGKENGHHCGIACKNGANPTISNITIQGRGSSEQSGYAYGMLLYHSAARVEQCTIDPGNSTSESYGILCSLTDSPHPTIDSNTISGGVSDSTFGIYIQAGSNVTVTENTITGGDWTDGSYGICIVVEESSPVITDNTLRIYGNLSSTYGVYETSETSDPASVRRNDFDYDGSWYRDEAATTIDKNNYNSTTVSTGEGTDYLFGTWANYSTATGLP